MKYSILWVALLLSPAACVKEPGPFGTDPDTGRPTVPVTLSLAVAPEEPATKGAFDPDEPGYDASAAIRTVTVLQFEKDAEGDGYKRVGNQVCYDYDAVLAGTENIPLVTSARENIIFVVANATDPGLETIQLPGHGTLSDFLERQNGNLLSSLGSEDGTGILYAPAGGTEKYLRMSAAVKVDGVTLGTTIGTSGSPLALKRNCAKVVVHVKNTSATSSDPLTVEAVQLRDINQLYHYVTNIPSGLPVSFSDPYSPMNPRRFDNGEEVFPAACNASGATQTYTYYVPANLRGTVANTSQADKNRHAPQGATRFCVYATYGTPAKHITYTYYLGADLTSDFNLEANKKYEFVVDLTERGDADTDSRIEDVAQVVFRTDANCYMLTPPARSGASTIFSIPVSRAAVFWNGPGTNMGVYGAAQSEDYELPESTDWEAFFVWNEVTDGAGVPVPDSALLVDSHDDGEGNYVAAGRGFNPGDGAANPFIRVKITNGMKGNALVAIRKKSAPTQGDILWSWHLWVTDYNPYIDVQPLAGNYVYAVPGGNLHRYAGDTWNTAAYGHAFIMDRNLGAALAVPEDGDYTPAFGFFYQHGRKDPLPSTGQAPVEYANHTGPEPAGDVTKYNVRYSIHHPSIYLGGFYANSSWTAYEPGGVVLAAGKAAWLDARVAQHGPDHCEPGKSIYDPCPPGWRVPVNGVWSDFNSTTLEDTTPRVATYYYPESYDPLAQKGRVAYPFTGVRRTTQPEAVTVVCAMATSTIGINVRTYNSGYQVASPLYALPVRCIRMNYTRPY